MRRSLREPLKSEPPFEVRSPLHPTRREEAEAAGSVMVAAEEKTSEPSRKAKTAPGNAKMPERDCVNGIGRTATLLGRTKDATTIASDEPRKETTAEFARSANDVPHALSLRT